MLVIICVESLIVINLIHYFLGFAHNLNCVSSNLVLSMCHMYHIHVSQFPATIREWMNVKSIIVCYAKEQ